MDDYACNAGLVDKRSLNSFVRIVKNRDGVSKVKNLIMNAAMSLGNVWPWFGDKVNALMINKTVNVCRHRPHPWSTVHDYVSWKSLTDKSWSARHLPAKTISNQPPAQEVIGLFKRPAGEQRLCHKSTCLFPAFAQYLTDGFIRTQMDQRLKNTSNHEIDLCPLYGRTEEQTDALRVHDETSGNRGRLKSQMINGEEYSPFLYREDGSVDPQFTVLDAPLGIDKHESQELRARIFAAGGDRVNSVPQVAMMNTLFLREHNRLAGEIEKIHPDWDDEQVFETARNTVIVIFIKIVVEEYINHISPAPIPFRADPSVAWEAKWNKPNWITAEFSLLYRWHSLIPDTVKWNHKDYPVHETFMDNRPLLDAGLAQGFIDMSAQRAGCLGPFNTTVSLLEVEAASIEQGRQSRLASYCDYREYVSLSRPKKFSEISNNPEVVGFLENVYDRVDDIDFYVGLFAEDTVQNSPLPPLILRMVAVDAFSQALTNPLLSEHVFNAATFSSTGWEAIQNTSSLKDILARNVDASLDNAKVGMTLENWKPNN